MTKLIVSFHNFANAPKRQKYTKLMYSSFECLWTIFRESIVVLLLCFGLICKYTFVRYSMKAVTRRDVA